MPPRALTHRAEARNAANASKAAGAMARAVGAPAVHASHSGSIESPLPWLGVPYRGHYDGATAICDASGAELARRDARRGAGVVLADVVPSRHPPRDEPPDRYWMHRRGAIPAAAWAYQRAHGRRWYHRHALGRPAAEVEWAAGAPTAG